MSNRVFERKGDLLKTSQMAAKNYNQVQCYFLHYHVKNSHLRQQGKMGSKKDIVKLKDKIKKRKHVEGSFSMP